MKKLLIITTVVLFGMTAYAQNANPTKTKPDAPATTQPAPNSVKDAANVSAVSTVKETEKKDCAKDEKSCGDMKKGKSCCSPKAKGTDSK